MKTRLFSVLIAVVILVASTAYGSDTISPKSHKGYVVHSVIDGHQATMAYNQRGKWVYTIQQYSLDDLDKNNVDRIRSVYYDYNVTGIQKVEQPGMDPVYVVHLENLKSIKLVRLTNDEMELVEDIIKG